MASPSKDLWRLLQSQEPNFSIEALRRDERVVARFRVRLEGVGAIAAVLVSEKHGLRVRPHAVAVGGRWFSSTTLSTQFEQRVRERVLDELARMEACKARPR